MKTAISIPDSVFQAAEKHAKRMRKSRSQLFSEAMVEYLERHTPDEITRMLNETLETVSDMEDSFIPSPFVPVHAPGGNNKSLIIEFFDDKN